MKSENVFHCVLVFVFFTIKSQLDFFCSQIAKDSHKCLQCFVIWVVLWAFCLTFEDSSHRPCEMGKKESKTENYGPSTAAQKKQETISSSPVHCWAAVLKNYKVNLGTQQKETLKDEKHIFSRFPLSCGFEFCSFTKERTLMTFAWKSYWWWNWGSSTRVDQPFDSKMLLSLWRSWKRWQAPLNLLLDEISSI